MKDSRGPTSKGADKPGPLPLTESGSGVSFAVRVIPRAGRTAIAGVRGDALVVRLAAPPVEGAANAALVNYLAERLDMPRRNIEIRSGHASRDKRVALAGIAAADAAARLFAILAEL